LNDFVNAPKGVLPQQFTKFFSIVGMENLITKMAVQGKPLSKAGAYLALRKGIILSIIFLFYLLIGEHRRKQGETKASCAK